MNQERIKRRQTQSLIDYKKVLRLYYVVTPFDLAGDLCPASPAVWARVRGAAGPLRAGTVAKEGHQGVLLLHRSSGHGERERENNNGGGRVGLSFLLLFNIQISPHWGIKTLMIYEALFTIHSSGHTLNRIVIPFHLAKHF